MKAALIADTHGILPSNIPDKADIIIHAGDICPDNVDQYHWLETKWAQWALRLDRPVYATFGNHDFVKPNRLHLPKGHAQIM